MPKTTPANVQHSSPSPLANKVIEQSWGADKPATTVQEALNNSPTKHPTPTGGSK